jgi:hypothetical protein
MKATINQNFVVYSIATRERFVVTEGDKVDVISKNDVESKVTFLDGDAKGTTHDVSNMYLDYEDE